MAKLPIIDPETIALLRLGWIRALDVVIFLIVIFLSALTTVGVLFGFLETNQILLCGISALGLTQFWLLSVSYRACYFTLKMRAIIETMPQEAARIALNYADTKTVPPPVK